MSSGKPFVQVDAFATRPFAGNPAAVVFEADDLTDAQMPSSILMELVWYAGPA